MCVCVLVDPRKNLLQQSDKEQSDKVPTCQILEATYRNLL